VAEMIFPKISHQLLMLNDKMRNKCEQS